MDIPANKEDKMRRCLKKVQAQGYSEDSAWAICMTTVMKKGKNANRNIQQGRSEKKNS